MMSQNLEEVFRMQYEQGFFDGTQAMMASGMLLFHYVVTVCLIIAVYRLYKKSK